MTRLSLWWMGAGGGCDAQYVLATDILGEGQGPLPRHAKVYRGFASEYARLQAERVAAFREFAADVAADAFPTDPCRETMDPGELAAFRARLPGAE